MELEKVLQAQTSLFGSACVLCDKPVQKGDKVLSHERKVGIGIVSKTIRFEIHIPCAVTARDFISKLIEKATGS